MLHLRYVLRCGAWLYALGFGLLTATSIPAGENLVEPGQWKVTSTTVINGVVQPSQAKGRCISAEQAADIAKTFDQGPLDVRVNVLEFDSEGEIAALDFRRDAVQGGDEATLHASLIEGFAALEEIEGHGGHRDSDIRSAQNSTSSSSNSSGSVLAPAIHSCMSGIAMMVLQ